VIGSQDVDIDNVSQDCSTDQLNVGDAYLYCRLETIAFEQTTRILSAIRDARYEVKYVEN